MADAYALALLIGMPLYVVFILTRLGMSSDGELHPFRALAAAMLVAAAATVLIELDRFF